MRTLKRYTLKVSLRACLLFFFLSPLAAADLTALADFLAGAALAFLDSF